MFIRSTIILLFCVIYVSPINVFTQQPVPIQHQMLQNNSMGREFWLCIPQNDATLYASLSISVTSLQPTRVTIEAGGFKISKNITQPAQMIVFDESALFENVIISQSEQVTKQGIRITADEPISVYVFNRVAATADSYMAFPTTALGKRYIHCGYYDHGEFNWGGYLSFVATEDNTLVRISLKGRNVAGALGRTKGGRSIGDEWTVRLNKGETYMVRGNGLSTGMFDFTGTSVVANKPIAFVSGHQRTAIPSLGANNRNFLMEMLPPIETWGKTYTTVELDRSAPSQGDFMRVVAAEDNTDIRVRWWQKNGDRRLLRDETIRLNKAGDWWEFQQNFDSNPQTRMGVVGTSLWEANKPILVTQYAYSGTFWKISTDNIDPVMLAVVPREQFVKKALVQVPDNYIMRLTLIAQGNPDDVNRHQELLRSITIDGVPIYVQNGSILGNRIPTTDLFWTYVDVPAGAHIIESTTPFSGYGFVNNNTIQYLWMIGNALNKLDYIDTLAPEMVVVDTCGIYTVSLFERNNSIVQAQGQYAHVGLRAVEMLQADNMKLVLPPSGRPKPQDSVTEYLFHVHVIDNNKPAFAVLYTDDRAGNYRLDTIRFAPQTLISDTLVLAPTTPVGSSSATVISVTNPLSYPIQLLHITSATAQAFRLHDTFTLPAEIPPGASLSLPFLFAPLTEGYIQENLQLLSSCLLPRQITMTGNATPTSLDTLPPVITRISASCDSILFAATEKRLLPPSLGNLPQQDRGITKVQLQQSDNMRLTTYQQLSDNNPQQEVFFAVKPISTKRSAFAMVEVLDKNGNVTLDSVFFPASDVASSPITLDWGVVPDGTIAEKELYVINRSEETIVIDSLLTLAPSVFSLLSEGSMNIASGEQQRIGIRFHAPSGDSVQRVYSADVRIALSCGYRSIATLTAISDRTTSVTESQQSLSTRLMPNPTNGEFTTLAYSIPRSSAVSIVLISPIGKSETLFQGMMNAGEHTFVLPTSSFASGSYVLHISTNSERKTIPLLIIR